jgi:hypothetical protein
VWVANLVNTVVGSCLQSLRNLVFYSKRKFLVYLEVTSYSEIFIKEEMHYVYWLGVEGIIHLHIGVRSLASCEGHSQNEGLD